MPWKNREARNAYQRRYYRKLKAEGRLKSYGPLVECACGCGATFPKYDWRGRERRFLHGHNKFRGGRIKTSRGYIKISVHEHPFADPYGYEFEHRLVMEEHLGRYLTPEEAVHHINGKKDDNRLENLRLFPNASEHHIFEAQLRRQRL